MFDLYTMCVINPAVLPHGDTSDAAHFINSVDVVSRSADQLKKNGWDGPSLVALAQGLPRREGFSVNDGVRSDCYPNNARALCFIKFVDPHSLIASGLRPSNPLALPTPTGV